MYFFDKKTEYFIWNRKEGQVKGVGTIKFLAMDEVCRIEAVVTSCGNTQGTYPVYVLSGNVQSLLGRITLHKGKGNFYIKCSTNTLGHKALPYKQVTGVCIDLKTEGSLEQKWLPMIEEMTEHAKTPKEVTHTKQEQAKVVSSTENSNEKNIPKQELSKVSDNKKPEPSDTKPPQSEAMHLHTNKWTQLCAIYPIVHPFQDGRAYLSIEPRDFVILQERYQPMVQNSFLLHGFYHYRHLLLGRMKQGQQVQYYLGVPGVFYEKEKNAALFYGFESFEGAVTPAREGSFGYYMKRVQI